jgi:hypothetical protein
MMRTIVTSTACPTMTCLRNFTPPKPATSTP